MRIAADGPDQRLARLEAEGDRRLHADARPSPSTATRSLADNNTLTAPISIREEKLRVLVVESYPRWEYRYLRNALSRDPGVELSCLLFHPGLSKPGGGNKDYIKQFPTGLDELSKYRRRLPGRRGRGGRPADGRAVPAAQGAGRAPGERPGLHAGLAGARVLAAGDRAGRPLSGRARPGAARRLGLADAQPLRADRARPPQPAHQAGRHRRTTTPKSGRGCPASSGTPRCLRAKAGSDVLCVHKDASNEFGRLPLLVTRTFGAGKVLFMGTDGAWRWRKGVEDKYHYRFWGQVVRWMAYQRNMAKGETMRLYYVPDQPRMNQTLALHANVMEQSGEPLHGGDVTARITAPSGKAEMVRFASGGRRVGRVHRPVHGRTRPGSTR